MRGRFGAKGANPFSAQLQRWAPFGETLLSRRRQRFPPSLIVLEANAICQGRAQRARPCSSAARLLLPPPPLVSDLAHSLLGIICDIPPGSMSISRRTCLCGRAQEMPGSRWSDAGLQGDTLRLACRLAVESVGCPLLRDLRQIPPISTAVPLKLAKASTNAAPARLGNQVKFADNPCDGAGHWQSGSLVRRTPRVCSSLSRSGLHCLLPPPMPHESPMTGRDPSDMLPVAPALVVGGGLLLLPGPRSLCMLGAISNTCSQGLVEAQLVEFPSPSWQRPVQLDRSPGAENKKEMSC